MYKIAVVIGDGRRYFFTRWRDGKPCGEYYLALRGEAKTFKNLTYAVKTALRLLAFYRDSSEVYTTYVIDENKKSHFTMSNHEYMAKKQKAEMDIINDAFSNNGVVSNVTAKDGVLGNTFYCGGIIVVDTIDQAESMHRKSAEVMNSLGYRLLRTAERKEENKETYSARRYYHKRPLQ